MPPEAGSVGVERNQVSGNLLSQVFREARVCRFGRAASLAGQPVWPCVASQEAARQRPEGLDWDLLNQKHRLPPVSALFLFLCASLSQAILPKGFAQAPARTDGFLPLAEREALARPFLVEAESEAGNFDAASRSLVLYRAAGAWFALDRRKSIEVYREAFRYAVTVKAPIQRESLEQAILNDLLPLSASDVLELLAEATPATKEREYGAIINFSLFRADQNMAVRAFDEAVAHGVLPMRSTIHLIAGLPPAAAERQRIFSAAASYYEAHPSGEPWRWTIANLVARFYAQLPRAVVLRAIDVALAQAEELDRRQPGGSFGMGSGENSLQFHSQYDLQLFAVAPALRHFDEKRATALLREHAEAAAELKRYPRGLPSFDPIDHAPGAKVLRPDVREPEGLQLFNKIYEGQNLSPTDMGLEFTIPRQPPLMGITGSGLFYAQPNSPEALALQKIGNNCPTDLAKRLQEGAQEAPFDRKVPVECSGPLESQRCSYQETFPRADLVRFIAEGCTYSGSNGAAEDALHFLVDLMRQVPAERRTDYLATAADMYLRLGKRKAAAQVVEKGLEAAAADYQRELARADLKDFPAGMWSSAEAYRTMINLGVNASLEVTKRGVDGIPDAALRELERVMIARALLGVPFRRGMTAGSGGGFCVLESDISYDRF